jgi:hypothetical protein
MEVYRGLLNQMMQMTPVDQQEATAPARRLQEMGRSSVDRGEWNRNE